LTSGADRDQVLRAAVESEVRATLGADAPPQIVDSIVQRFKDDPSLQEVFEQAARAAQSR